MTRIRFEYVGADPDISRAMIKGYPVERDWPAVPRTGDGLVMTVDDEQIEGEVTYVWFLDPMGSAQVRFR